jgi:hypothetical protein
VTLTVSELSSSNMFGESKVDPGPFTCPVCRKVSFNSEDAIHGWCGACKTATGVPFDGPGTKVLVVGDTGGDVEWLSEEVVPYAKATGCVRIVQCGDFGFVWTKFAVHKNLDEIHELLQEAGLTLVFLPGNHENHPLLERLAEAADQNEDGHYVLRPTILYTGRVAAWTWDGLRMAAVGGGVSIDRDDRVPGVSWWPEETLQPEEVQAAVDLGPVDILFTHDAPLGVPMRLLPDMTSAAHRAYMTQVGEGMKAAYWFHGHYHASLFYRFHHTVGVTTVRGLNCNRTQSNTDAMVPINLGAIRKGLAVAHYGPEA